MKKLVAALLVGTMCFGLVGCGQTADTSADAPAETTTEDAADAATDVADEAAADDGEVFIGLAMHNQTETWAVQFADTFKEEAEAAGAKVAVTDANSTPANQVSQIEDLVAQGIDVLVVLPADYTALGNALKVAKDAGVKIVNADSKVDEADQDMVDCFVTADCYTAGYTAGEYLAEKLEKDATLGALNYSQLSVIADRFTGMRDALKDKERDDVTIVEKDCTDLSAIASYTEDMLIGNPEISAFLCLNDNTALTCYGTCAQMNKADCIVIGFDGSPAGKQSIADGQMTGTMVYSPVDLAKTSLDAGIKLAKGETVDKEAQVEMWMINSDNIKDYNLESWD